ncbi:MAG: hypothetical protein AW08_01650 [Candidatus Accumulibacter adjunctus]|uniref:Uncharacterized protein n=1 Tax=Candidatus Accumulibacter adjunctus TaxID=1454001 RepID=A0A011PN10_9PROT|nr:MAG: hypothetical protein AW08_01650 [Candidatus Accumulibacter adjunctus]
MVEGLAEQEAHQGLAQVIGEPETFQCCQYVELNLQRQWQPQFEILDRFAEKPGGDRSFGRNRPCRAEASSGGRCLIERATTSFRHFSLLLTLPGLQLPESGTAIDVLEQQPAQDIGATQALAGAQAFKGQSQSLGKPKLDHGVIGAKNREVGWQDGG